MSGSLSSGTAPLLEGNYWIDKKSSPFEADDITRPWPYYDPNDIVCGRYHELMTFMAELAKISAESINEQGMSNPLLTQQKAQSLRHNLLEWWNHCEPELRDQTSNWRQLERPRKLTVSETLEAEALSSAKSVMMGCLIYIQHILDPFSVIPNYEVDDALRFILETAAETPEGFGLEMGLHWGLFMAGTMVFNDPCAEDLIRHKLRADNSISIYVSLLSPYLETWLIYRQHASRALELLEVLWKRQSQYERKFDWREVQSQTGIQA